MDFALVLAAVAIKQNTSTDRSTPKVSYITCTDIFVFACLLLVGLSTFESPLVRYLSDEMPHQAETVDVTAFYMVGCAVVLLFLLSMLPCLLTTPWCHSRRGGPWD